MPTPRADRSPRSTAGNAPKPRLTKARKPAVLPKSDGDAGVHEWLASLEPWQATVARHVDALVRQHVPRLRTGIRWRCPFHGVEGQGWFLAMAAFQYHVKFTFFLGTSLEPVPPVGEQPFARSLDVREHDLLDEATWATWLAQCATMPGWDGGSAANGGLPL